MKCFAKCDIIHEQFGIFFTITNGGVNMARTILEIRRFNGVAYTYKLARTVAFDYTRSAASIARSSLMEKYDISESTYYTLLDMAITHHLINDDVAKQILEKKKSNQKTFGNNGYDSQVKYNLLVEQRNSYSAFSKKDIKHIAKYFANHPDLTKEEISKIYGFYRVQALDRVLLRACIELIITDKMFEEMRRRSTATSSNQERTEKFFDLLTQKRNDEKRKLKNKRGHSAF